MFNIEQEFLSAQYSDGFSLRARSLRSHGPAEVHEERTDLHGLALDGRTLTYVGSAGVKTGPIPDGWLPGPIDQRDE